MKMIISSLFNDIGELDMRYSKKTNMKVEEILEMTEKFFSKAGLAVTERTNCRICMENNDGFVTVQVKVMTTGELDIITEGFDERVKQFLKILE